LTKGTSSGATTGCSAVVLADWTNLVLGEWGVVELLTDPFGSTGLGKKAGMIQLTIFGQYDVSVIRPSSFACILDALPA
jgi:hypothetical protein